MNKTGIKQFLKRMSFMAETNARLKSLLTKREYARTVAYYERRSVPQQSFATMAAERMGERLSRFARTEQPHFFYLGTDEQQDRSGILQALEVCGRLTYFTRPDGSYGHNPTSGAFREFNTSRLWEMFRQLHDEGHVPDLLFAQTWNVLVDPVVFNRIRETFGTIVVNIGMDDRHQFRGVYPLIPYLDFALTAAPECVDWYRKEGCPALFFPEASDEAFFHPMPDLTKIHDVSFVGSRYGIRAELVEALMAAGVQVTAYGSGWEAGRIDTEEVPRLFAQSKIILGVGTIGYTRDFCALKMRDFDGPISGSCYVTQGNPDLELLYDVGQEIVTYRNIDDCVRLVRYYLEHDEEREAIAAQGLARARRDHTWIQRFQQVLNTLRQASAV